MNSKLRFCMLLCLLLASCGPPPEDTQTREPARMEPGPVDPDAAEEFTSTQSGLKYRIRRASDGPKPDGDDMVRVHYRGWLDDGTVFDQSYGKRSASFEVGGVVPGFREGLQLIGRGGMIELEMPPDLGYGPAGAPPRIPPAATLHFLIELEEVMPL